MIPIHPFEFKNQYGYASYDTYAVTNVTGGFRHVRGVLGCETWCTKRRTIYGIN